MSKQEHLKYSLMWFLLNSGKKDQVLEMLISFQQLGSSLLQIAAGETQL